MFPFQNHYGYESWLNQDYNFFQEPTSVNLLDNGGDSILSSASKTERKSAEACKSHKEAERRRRQRINAHLSTLRTLLPNTTKTDKASLLAEVVQHVKELRKQVDDVAARQDGEGWCSSSSGTFPGESDEVGVVSYYDGETKLIKVSLCCEDRPGLNRDLNRAIQSVRARAVRAEMMTVGGRTKCVVVMQWADESGGDEEEIEVLKRALNNVVENRASESGLGRVMAVGSKRARVYGSVNESSDGS